MALGQINGAPNETRMNVVSVISNQDQVVTSQNFICDHRVVFGLAFCLMTYQSSQVI